MKSHPFWLPRADDKTTRYYNQERTPAENYIFLSNTGACILLAVMSYMAKGSSDINDVLWVLYLTPGGKSPIRIRPIICSHYTRSGVRDSRGSKEGVVLC